MIPAARITLDGQDITANLIPAPFGLPLAAGGVSIVGGWLKDGAPLVSLTVTDNEGNKSDSCELEVDNSDQQPSPKKGGEVKVWLGYADDGGLHYMGSYKVSSWTKKGRPRSMTVSASAADLNGELKEPRSRSYHKKKIKEIVEQIAGKHKLGSKVHPEIGDIEVPHIDQSTESDMHFISRLVKRFGGVAKIGDGNWIVNKPGSGTAPGGGEGGSFTISETGNIDWSAEGSERGHYKSVSAAFQNIEKGAREWVEEGEGKPKFRDRRLYKTEEEAKKAAKGQLEAAQRGKVTVTINMPGRPELYAGARCSLQDFDPDVDGQYTIKTVTHTLDSDGFKTALNLDSVGGEDSEDEGGGEGGGEGSGNSEE